MDQTALLSANYSQLGPLLIGEQSIFTPTFWNKSNIHVVDETSVYTPVRDGTTWGGTCRFVQPKRATLACSYLLEIVLSGSTLTNPAVNAAYVNNLGDQILAQVTHRYANNVLHQYDGEYQQLYQRLTTNEVNEEGRNALTLGGLPLTSGNGLPETQRAATLINGFTLYVPLDRLWFTQHLDEAWMPEAYATEGEIEIQLARLEDVVYACNGAAGVPGVGTLPSSPFTGAATRPQITSIRLIAREATLTVPEKMARLSYFETDRGMLTHFLDVERQRRVTLVGTGTAVLNREFRVRLDNVRLDMQEIMFVVRRGEGAGVDCLQACIDRD